MPITVPMAPLTNPTVTSILRLSITLQPTAKDSTVSKPAVLLGRSFSFSNFFLVFCQILLCCHFHQQHQHKLVLFCQFLDFLTSIH